MSPARRKRGYSRDYTARTERRVQLSLDRVPPTLIEAARVKAHREGLSVRALVLGLLTTYVNTPEPEGGAQ
jgi:predicted HicB family RNase H-like nuclease